MRKAHENAGLAQLVEHLPCKQRVGSSSLLTSSIVFNQCLTRDIWCWVSYSSGQRGQTVNLLAFAFRGSNPRLTTIAGVAQLARASAFQAEGRGFEPRFPLHFGVWRINWELFLWRLRAVLPWIFLNLWRKILNLWFKVRQGSRKSVNLRLKTAILAGKFAKFVNFQAKIAKKARISSKIQILPRKFKANSALGGLFHQFSCLVFLIFWALVWLRGRALPW